MDFEIGDRVRISYWPIEGHEGVIEVAGDDIVKVRVPRESVTTLITRGDLASAPVEGDTDPMNGRQDGSRRCDFHVDYLTKEPDTQCPACERMADIVENDYLCEDCRYGVQDDFAQLELDV